MIEWDEGLNLGVEILDDEHKKLLEIINKLSSAMCNHSTKEIIGSMFIELKKSLESHAKTELLILEQCNYKELNLYIEHLNQLQNEVEKLKSKIMDADGYNDAQYINKSLMELLLKHIIIEDMPLVTVFKKCDIIKNTKYTSMFERLILRTTDTFSFTKRLLLSALIPLLGMLILGFIVLVDHYHRYNEVKTTFNISRILLNIDELAHYLQVERGLSSGYLTSKGNKFEEDLKNQHLIVNEAIKSFNLKLQTVNIDKLKTVKPYINSFREDTRSLGNIRKKVADKNIRQTDVINFYTDIIKNILNITSRIVLFKHNEEISSSISALSSILQFKEALGQERAYSTMLIEQKSINPQEYIKFIELLTVQKEYLNAFKQTATTSQKQFQETLINFSTVKEVISYRSHIKDYDIASLDSQIWFKHMTNFINNVKLLEDQLLQETHLLLKNNMEETLNSFILFFFYTFLIFISTVFFLFLFERSSKEQISHMIEAITHLAKGGRNLRLADNTVNDEMMKMHNAYEATRQKLLIGNMYTKLYMIQKEAALKKEQKQNLLLEEMAFIDPLTGAINRRKFEELSNQELIRSIRYRSSLSFLMLDLDYFKNINDTYGHATGDELLKHFVSICKEMVRNLDVVARMGGEEFCIILPETDEEGAYLFAERVRKKVFNSAVTYQNKTIRYSVSIGIAFLNVDEDKDINAILQRADKALYEAKNSGRNRTVIYK